MSIFVHQNGSKAINGVSLSTFENVRGRDEQPKEARGAESKEKVPVPYPMRGSGEQLCLQCKMFAFCG